MAYVVEVIPPKAGEAIFEVEEPTFEDACERARRYRQRGYGAAISYATDRPRWWRVWSLGIDLPPMEMRCRSMGCAMAMARRVSRDYVAAQPIEVEEEVTA